METKNVVVLSPVLLSRGFISSHFPGEEETNRRRCESTVT